MTNEPTRCPLCQRDDALLVETAAYGRDAVRLACPRCGKFCVDGVARGALQRAMAGQLHLVSWATRTASDTGGEVFIDTIETAEALAASAPTWRTADEGVGQLLVALGAKARRFTEQLTIRPEMDYPLIPVKDDSGYADLWQLAGQMGYVDTQYGRITPAGWRRIEELRTVLAYRRQAFVAMRFHASTEEAWLNGFKPGIEASEYYSAFRIDRKEYNNKIDDEIVSEIRRSGLLVADFTGHRANVYFEAGLGMGLRLPVIWTCNQSDIESAHFDTRQYNHVVWNTPADLAEKLDRRIRATVLPLVRPSA